MRKPPESINRLSRKQVRELEDYTREHYAAAGKTDTAFAADAAAALSFPVTGHNVAAARLIFDIPSTRDTLRSVAGDPNAVVLSRLAAVERDIATLRQRFEVYITGCRGDK